MSEQTVPYAARADHATRPTKSRSKFNVWLAMPEYRAWANAKNRCTNPKNQSYKDYGARGIAMAPIFMGSFKTFFEEVGVKPSAEHSLDRIDNSKGYEPGNLRWATRTQQNRNSRHTILTPQDVAEIRISHESSPVLASRYSVSESSIRMVRRYEVWRDE